MCIIHFPLHYLLKYLFFHSMDLKYISSLSNPVCTITLFRLNYMTQSVIANPFAYDEHRAKMVGEKTKKNVSFTHSDKEREVNKALGSSVKKSFGTKKKS